MMNKKGEKIILENTVVTILFILLFIVVVIILTGWWNKYHSKDNIPAMKSLDLLQKNINLLKEGSTRSVPLQTAHSGEEYYIQGFENLDFCEHCICICRELCVYEEKELEKYCRKINYEFRDRIYSEEIRTFEFTLKNDLIILRNE
jgi:hypothetical protein